MSLLDRVRAFFLRDSNQLLIYSAFLLLCFVALRPGYVMPDSVAYYSFLPSLFLDGDLNFVNEYIRAGVYSPGRFLLPGLTANGYAFNPFPMGTAMLWSPFWLIGLALSSVAGKLGQNVPAGGFYFYNYYAVLFSTALMGLCTLQLGKNLSQRFSEGPSATAALAVAFGTPFFWYCLINAGMSHIPIAFIITLFLIVLLRLGHDSKAVPFLLGILGGITIIIRPDDAVVLIFPAFVWIEQIKNGSVSLKNVFRELLILLVGLTIPIGLQLWAWNIIFGNPLGPANAGMVKDYYHLFDSLNLIPVLFSSYHGLFFFSPLLILCFHGLILLRRTHPAFAYASLFVIVSQILFLSFGRWFWEGHSFGLRRMVVWTPLYIVGLTVWLERYKSSLLRLVAALAVLWAVLLVWTYSSQSMSLLNLYQTPREILSMFLTTLQNLPESLIQKFTLAAPWRFSLPTMLALVPIGYVVFRFFSSCFSPQANDQDRSVRNLLMVTLLLLGAMYGLVMRAQINFQSSKIRFSKELAWVASNQNRMDGADLVEFILQEGIYRCRSGDRSSALASFQEALQVSPVPAGMDMHILEIASSCLSQQEVQQLRTPGTATTP